MTLPAGNKRIRLTANERVPFTSPFQDDVLAGILFGEYKAGLNDGF
ncbi:hypothetical protein [Brenneria rubrifaciens]|nr:hypothetical protein [Brenneria rubrifaciens]